MWYIVLFLFLVARKKLYYQINHVFFLEEQVISGTITRDLHRFSEIIFLELFNSKTFLNEFFSIKKTYSEKKTDFSTRK